VDDHTILLLHDNNFFIAIKIATPCPCLFKMFDFPFEFLATLRFS
jgi:hypothetical protein